MSAAHVLGILDALEVVGRHARVLALPLVVRRRADAVLAANLRHGQGSRALAQDRKDLALCEFRLPHRSSSKRRKPLFLACLLSGGACELVSANPRALHLHFLKSSCSRRTLPDG